MNNRRIFEENFRRRIKKADIHVYLQSYRDTIKDNDFMLQIIFLREFILHDVFIFEFYFIESLYHLNFPNCKSNTYMLLKQQIAKVLVLPTH